MLNFKFAKFASVFFVSVFVLFAHNVSLAQERVADTKTLTNIEIKDVKIEKSDTGIKITGALFNPSKNIITPEITHLLILKTIDPLIQPKDERELLPSLIVAADEGKDFFSLKPNEQKVFSYILPFSPYVPQANYSLYLGFIRANGQVEVSYENSVKNLGSSQKEAFLAFDQESCVLLNKEGKKFGNNDGPTLLSGEGPEVRCLIKNIGDKEIEVSPKILWKEVFVYGKPLDGTMAIENPDQKIFFKPGETKLVSLFMPKAEKPQVYQSLVSFEDKDGGSRSFNMFFRWTIAGESARIKGVTQISPLKDTYAKGEKIDLSVDYFGSADLFWTGTGQDVSNLSRLKILAIVKDKSNEICGANVFNLPNINDSASKNKIIGVVMEKRCENASYSVSVHSGEKKLAEESGELPKVVKERNAAPYLYFGLPALMILLGFAFFRKKKIVPIHLLIILFASMTMFFGLALAVETQIYPDSWGGTTSKGNWWGDWTISGGTEKLMSNPSGGGGVNTLRIYSAEADFSDSFNTGGAGTVFLDYRATDQSCENTAMKVSVQMSIIADGLSEQYITFAKTGSNSYSTEKRYWYKNTVGSIVEKGFDIPASVIAAFYDNNKKAKTNPKLVIHFKQIGYQSHDDKYSKGYFKGNESAKLRTENDAFNVSDIIQIEIPLKIPSPSVSLSAPSTVTSPNTAEVTLTTTDLSGGVYRNTHSAAIGANGFDSLSFDSTPNNGTKSQTKTVLNVWISGSSNSSQINNLKITYTRDLGQYIGTGTYTAEATVTVKPAPASSSSSSSSSSSLSNSSSSSSGSAPSQPQNFTASAACQSVNLEWDKDKNGEYKSITNSGSKVVNYYEITRDGSYTIKKSDNINRSGWSNNSYTDSSATDTGKKYSYKIKACNDQSQCSSETGPALATPTAGPCSGNPSSNPSSTPSSSPSSTSAPTDPDWYNLTFKTSGSGSGNSTRYNYDDTFGWTGSKTMSNGDTAGIGRDYKFKLVPNPSSGSYFSSWSGCGSVNSDNECILEKNPYPGADKTVTATFNDSTGGCVGCGSSVKAYISARDTVVTDGNSTMVTWTSDNADSCEQKDGGSDTSWVSASDTTSGSYTTNNFTTSGGSRTYKVTCANGSQTADAETTVSVGNDYTGSPSVNMWADSQSVGYKKTSTIKWMASNIQANQCSVLYSSSDSMNGYMTWYNFASLPFGNGYYKSGIGANNTTGQTTGKLASNTTYKIQCKGYGPSYTKVNAQTTVTVAAPVSNFTIANSSGTALVANIVEGLSANSSNIALTLSGETIGNISISGSIPAILSGAKAQFSSDDGVTWSETLSIDISAISQVKIRVIKIPGATPAGIYNVAITATDTGTGGKTKKLNVNLQVNRVSSEWEEF